MQSVYLSFENNEKFIVHAMNNSAGFFKIHSNGYHFVDLFKADSKYIHILRTFRSENIGTFRRFPKHAEFPIKRKSKISPEEIIKNIKIQNTRPYKIYIYWESAFHKLQNDIVLEHSLFLLVLARL